MAEKILNTRISLKYDTLANWNNTTKAGAGANFVLKKGEVGFVEIPASSTSATTAPTVMFKVGDGTTAFKDLKWVSAAAADVYNWAKAETKPSYAATEINGLDEYIAGKVQDTNTTYQVVDILENNKVVGYKIQHKNIGDTNWTDDRTIDILTEDEVLDLIGDAIDDLIDGATTDYNTLHKLETKIKAEATRAQDAEEDLETAIGAEKTRAENAEAALLGTSADAATANTIYGAKKAVADEKARAEGVEAGLRTDVNAKVASVTGQNAIKVTTGTAPTVSLALDATGNVTLTQSANGLKANVEIPAATVTGVKDGEKVLSLDGTELKTTLSLAYDSTNKKIQLKGIDGEVVADLDATAFVKDGMIKYAYYIDKTGKYIDPADGQEKTDTAHKNNLVIVFNDGGTASVDEKIYINLADLIDLYTAGNGINVASNVISVKRDADSEGFLTVGANGVKLAGVQTAINTAKTDAIAQAAADAAELYVEKEAGKGLSTEDYTTAEKTKLAGIAAGATKVEASTTNGNIKINGVEKTVYTEPTDVVHDSNYKHITVTASSVSDGTTTFNKYVHPTKTATAAAAKKVGYDNLGHVVLGDALTPADVGAQAAFTDGTATIATVSNGVVTLKGGVKQTNGTISNQGTDVALKKIATTANVNDLEQTDGDVLVFNCGGAGITA